MLTPVPLQSRRSALSFFLLLAALGLLLPARAHALPAGFTKTPVASGLTRPTAMVFAPDGRLFVAERGSPTDSAKVRIVKNGALLPAPFATITVDKTNVAVNERGLVGLALAPDFATSRGVYVYYTLNTTPARNRITRFTANGDVASSGSEVTLLTLETVNAGNNNGGALAFGADGLLYIGVGDNKVPANSTNLTNHLGKLLRLNPDGSVPINNPFYDASDGITARDRIFAFGIRNPFKLAAQPGTGRMFFNDVGEASREEINEVTAGKDYGWRGGTTDGDATAWFKYDQTVGKCIGGGVFYNPSTPAPGFEAYVGKYFFSDYISGWIRVIDPITKTVTTFDSGLAGPVDLKVAPDGKLWFLNYNAGEIGQISGGAGPTQDLVVSTTGMEVAEGSGNAFTVRLSLAMTTNVTVSVVATGDPSVSASPQSLTFTPANWNIPQTVTVAAAEDADLVTGTATVTVSSSGVPSKSVAIAAPDNDGAGPTAVISAPLDGAVISGTTNDFYGTAMPDLSNVKAEFYLDGTLRYTDVGPGHYHYLGSHGTWDSTLMTEGSHSLKMTVYDSAARSGSHQVQVTVDNLPGDWQHSDVGAVAAAGSASSSGSTFTLKGSGADIYETADAMHLAYRSVTGDVTITAQVKSLEAIAPWTKAGVMMRDGTAAGAPNVFALLSPTATNKYRFQARATKDGSTSSSPSSGNSAIPAFLRIVRAGNVFTASVSTNGATFTPLGTSQTIAMPTTILVGLAVVSHTTNGTLASAVFDSVTISGGTGAPGPTNVPAEADAYVRSGTSATTNYGTASSLEVKSTSTTTTRRNGFLRFSLAGIGSNITSAKLRLYGNAVTTAKATGVHAVADIAWNESTLAWNYPSADAGGPAMSPAALNSKTVGLTAGWVEWDVTTYVQQQRAAGAAKISLGVKSAVQSDDGPTTFNAREGTNKPVLVITTSP